VNIKLPPAGMVAVAGEIFQFGASEILASTINSVVPLLVTVIVVSVVVPVITLTRFTKFILVSIVSNAVPCTEYTVGDPLALWVNVILPAVTPVAVGVYVISNIWLAPGSIVIGNVFGVKVNCPSDDVMSDITRSLVPGLSTVACKTAFDPIATLPKSRFGGVIEKVASTPVPCTEYTVGDPVALCVNVILLVYM
jgi:hypothetical protein